MNAAIPADRPVTLEQADFWDRVLARVIDGALCLFVPAPVAGVVASVTSDVVFYPVVLGIPLAYFAAGAMDGGTVGERGMSLRVLDAHSSNPPSLPRAIVHAICSTLLIVTGLVLVMYGFSDAPLGGYDASAERVIGAVAALLAISILARLWMLLDRDHRALTDHLAGVVVMHVATPGQDPSRESLDPPRT
jgi:uncharacterized RDD family membrane protein YckC